jgi:chorismate mutase
MNKQFVKSAEATLKKFALLRNQIDNLDARLIVLLKKRFHVVRQIGHIKRELGLPVFQKSRWTSLLRDRMRLSKDPDGELTLSSLFIRDLFTVIHSESLDLQEKLKKLKPIHKKPKPSKQHFK